MSQSDELKFERMLAFHSAPTLMGVKCANLFAVRQSDYRLAELEQLFASKEELSGFRMRFLCRCRDRVLAYVYHEELLRAWLSEEKVRAFLIGEGYGGDMTLDEMLDKLESRITCASFPHEIGAFLGYPIDDVRGFIENNGENCIFCGFWKVYSDPRGAQEKFDKYVYCRNFLCNKIELGLDLYQALATYKEETSR